MLLQGAPSSSALPQPQAPPPEAILITDTPLLVPAAAWNALQHRVFQLQAQHDELRESLRRVLQEHAPPPAAPAHWLLASASLLHTSAPLPSAPVGVALLQAAARGRLVRSRVATWRRQHTAATALQARARGKRTRRRWAGAVERRRVASRLARLEGRQEAEGRMREDLEAAIRKLWRDVYSSLAKAPEHEAKLEAALRKAKQELVEVLLTVCSPEDLGGVPRSERRTSDPDERLRAAAELCLKAAAQRQQLRAANARNACASGAEAAANDSSARLMATRADKENHPVHAPQFANLKIRKLEVDGRAHRSRMENTDVTSLNKSAPAEKELSPEAIKGALRAASVARRKEDAKAHAAALAKAAAEVDAQLDLELHAMANSPGSSDVYETECRFGHRRV
ncbi:hypothetical protein AB1Y20_020814 [Prymnesium parvum]|uniref:Uncharacterized protein n=1 Tax=Prymnesium parvum TaxID=97485 RepID=A0AB34JUN3_PRYPA